jgi:uncharacterized protein
MGKNLLIVGIDPGMTTAYALLDSSGTFILSRSAKELDLRQLLSEIHGQGKVIAVGTDKAKVPGLVGEFASKTGSKVFNPKEDLRVLEKKEATAQYAVQDAHEMDALASALFAYHELKPLLLKVDKFCEIENKSYLKEKIIETVIKKGMSIREAAFMLERPIPIKREQEKMVQEATVSQKTNEKKDALIKDLESQLEIVKRHAQELQHKITKIRQPTLIVKRDNTPDMRKKTERIAQLQALVHKKEQEKAKWVHKAQQLEQFLGKTQHSYVLKKLENLGSEEFRRKQFLGIQKDDILLVNDPNSMSMATVDEVRKTVSVIVHKMPISERVRTMLPFIFIDGTKLQIKENENFAIVQKKELDDLKSARRQLRSIVEDYQKERMIN